MPRSLLTRTYDEALALTVEARNYMAYREPAERRHLTANARLKMNREAFRLTSRLADIMAWLMSQRAVECGEVEPDRDWLERFKLDPDGIGAGHDGANLPPAMQDLLERSESLFHRVRRLDEQVRRRMH